MGVVFLGTIRFARICPRIDFRVWIRLVVSPEWRILAWAQAAAVSPLVSTHLDNGYYSVKAFKSALCHAEFSSVVVAGARVEIYEYPSLFNACQEILETETL